MHTSITRPSAQRSPRRSRRWLGAALLVPPLLATVGMPLARARAEKQAEHAGLALLESVGPALVGTAAAVSVNGQRMFLASRMTSLGVDEVLERVEQQCSEVRPGAASEPDAASKRDSWLAALDEPAALAADPERWRVVRHAEPDGSVGQIACVARSAAQHSSRLDAVLQFLQTLDVSRLGDARYVIARHDAASALTHVLGIWTEGSFDVTAMFPVGEDVPGGDSDLAPRPPESRRILSARVQDRPYALRLYTTPGDPDQIARHYELALIARGFSLATSPKLASLPRLPQLASRAFLRDGLAILLSAERAPSGVTVVSLVELGSPGYASLEQAP